MRLLKFTLIIALALIGLGTLSLKQYHNSPYKSGSPNIVDFLKWKFTRNKPVWPDLLKQDLVKQANVKPRVNSKTIEVTYINHSTTLIQTAGKNILTDPIWSSHAGPFGKFGVKRSIHPGLEINALPPIDFILISHSHYDHLDNPTITALAKIHNPILITGLGTSRYIDYCQKQKNNCYELNWWENHNLEDLHIHFVPAYHWSSRYLFDKNTSLWGGFVIDNGKEKIYFAGDTGFADGQIFKDIKAKYGDFSVSLLPIGAYKPSWFFSTMHTSPKEAVEILKIIDSNYAIAIHFDTFELTDDQYDDPRRDLSQATKLENIAENRFKVLSPGQTWKASSSQD